MPKNVTIGLYRNHSSASAPQQFCLLMSIYFCLLVIDVYHSCMQLYILVIFLNFNYISFFVLFSNAKCFGKVYQLLCNSIICFNKTCFYFSYCKSHKWTSLCGWLSTSSWQIKNEIRNACSSWYDDPYNHEVKLLICKVLFYLYFFHSLSFIFWHCHYWIPAHNFFYLLVLRWR